MTERVKKPTSLRNGIRSTLNGLMIHMLPATTLTINEAAPSSSPIARLPESARMAEKVLNTSGEAFPNARKVTPATFSSRPRKVAMVAKFGVKKSDADIPSVLNRNRSQSTKPAKIRGRRGAGAQK